MRSRVIVTAVAAAFAAVLVSLGTVRAHHAFAAEFDANKPVKFTEATVTKVQADQPPQLDPRRRQGAPTARSRTGRSKRGARTS